MGKRASIELEASSFLHVDDDLVALDKPAGVLCDATIDPKRDHLGTALSRWANDDEAQFFPIHRLDRGTSGVVLFARNRASATAVMQQFQERLVTKQYRAVVHLPSDEWTAGHTINRRSYLRHRKGLSEEVRSGGKSSESDFEVLRTDGALALVNASPKTGRTHQLRVHLAALGAPIMGDDRYGWTGDNDRTRLWLHADELTLTHPTTNEPLTIRSGTNVDLLNGDPIQMEAGDESPPRTHQ